jgi:integrase
MCILTSEEIPPMLAVTLLASGTSLASDLERVDFFGIESVFLKSIVNYVQVIKMVVASELNDKGEEIFPVKWNDNFMDLPAVDSSDQNTPTFTVGEIETILSKAEGQDRLLYALLAGTGLRVGEALALRVKDVEGSVLHVRHSLWNGKLSSPKTDAGRREVDLPSPLAEAVQEHLDDRGSGFLFQTSEGTPLAPSNLLRRSLHPILAEMKREKCGFHSFRRFRIAHLEKARVLEILIRLWAGHAPGSLTEKYAKQIREDRPFRQESCERAGLGFRIPEVAPMHPSTDVEMLSVNT